MIGIFASIFYLFLFNRVSVAQPGPSGLTIDNEMYSVPNMLTWNRHDRVQNLILGQEILNCYRGILNSIRTPSAISKYVEKLTSLLKSHQFTAESLEELGNRYIEAIQYFGFGQSQENLELLHLAFSLLGKVFLLNDLSVDFRKGGMHTHDFTLNDKNLQQDLEKIVQYIKNALATDSNGKQVLHRNINFNINVISLLGVGEKLRRANIV